MKRVLDAKEELIEAQYKLKQFTTLLALVSKDIGQDKIIEIARSSDYPKTDEDIEKMIEQGKLLKDIQRWHMSSEKGNTIIICEHLDLGNWAYWEDVEKIIKQ